ncbi:MAG: cryptochrome/photolyase family protein [Flavobacteriales bacterium]
MAKKKIAIYWMRRDLRLEDNAALWQALRSAYPVLTIFIFDCNILHKLANKRDARVLFIHRELQHLKSELEKMGSTLRTFYCTPAEAYSQLMQEFDIQAVHASRDYEPYAQLRDKEIFQQLAVPNIPFKGAKDHVIFEKEEVMKDDGKPYTVYTPYSRKWKQKLNEFYIKPYPTEEYFGNYFQCDPLSMHTLEQIGFEDFQFSFPERIADESILVNYEKTRDLPAVSGTSRLSMHLRFGTVSIRQLVGIAQRTSDKWLNELIWRDFYQMILFHFPHTAEAAFKPGYDRIAWMNDEKQFDRWCTGQTGYPLVDAGMRELNSTGFMHNRVRMVVASFLTKHLLIDWRWGERYFAEKLLDYECASNVGGWQWAAGCGCDAAPYFRIFNPQSQTEKFDKDLKYIRHWVPELNTTTYPAPMVDHKFARERCLNVFKKALSQ